MSKVIPLERVEERILLIRSHKVMIDADLAGVYGVLPKRLREQVRRNLTRFPAGFMFQLTKEEMMEVSAKCGHLSHLRFSPALPYAFTEHGAIMLAMVLNSKSAVEASVEVVKAFVRLREILSSNRDLADKLAKLERKYDHQFKVVFDAIRQLMEPPASKNKKIGFGRE